MDAQGCKSVVTWGMSLDQIEVPVGSVKVVPQWRWQDRSLQGMKGVKLTILDGLLFG